MSEIPRAQEQLFDRKRSAREKYAALVVGRSGWRALLKHEAVVLTSQHVPGALGFALRKALYPALLGALPPCGDLAAQRLQLALGDVGASGEQLGELPG